MYVVFYGSDRGAVRDAATEYLEREFPSGVSLTTIEGDGYEPGRVTDALGAQSLFGGSECFMLDTPSDQEDLYAETTSVLAELATSPNLFVILEGPLLAADKKQYERHATKMLEYVLAKDERFNSLALADALAEKDKRRLWVMLQDARLAGLREEEIVGMLWWQLKALRLAARTRTAGEAGMKDFPYNKAKRALAKFQDGEVERLAQSLLELYHDGHAGVREMDLTLEEWVLGLR